MNTVITHFYNEEYMLPWWINHHKKLFDHGIMINYASTDRSLEICKELCPPSWKIVDSTNSSFSASSCDQEVQEYEKTISGFKMALTIGEFLLTPMRLDQMNEIIGSQNYNYLKTNGICMVDTNPYDLPTHDKSLIEQKHYGMIDNYTANEMNVGIVQNSYNKLYSRHYHNQPYGNYSPGRHIIHDSNIIERNDIFTLKYKYCPWNEYTFKRMKQFGSRIPESDIKNRWGIHFLLSQEEHDTEYEYLKNQAHNLTENVTFKTAFDYCNSL